MEILYKPVVFVFEKFLDKNPLAILGLLPFIVLYYLSDNSKFLRILSFGWLALFLWVGFITYYYGKQLNMPIFTTIAYPILLLLTFIGFLKN